MLPTDVVTAFITYSKHGDGDKWDSFYKIKHKNNETAVLGKNVTIFCNLTTSEDIVQITWQKIQDSLPQNIGTYSSKYGAKILPPYLDRLHCETIEPNSSFITIREVTFEDEACYKCLFNMFPHGSHGGQICLNILTVSELRTELQSNADSEDFLRVITSAMGKPAPQISLFPSLLLINLSKEYRAQNPNGTVTVTKMVDISLETVWSLGLQHVIVNMDHPLRHEEKIVPLPIKKESESSTRLPWSAVKAEACHLVRRGAKMQRRVSRVRGSGGGRKVAISSRWPWGVEGRRAKSAEFCSRAPARSLVRGGDGSALP
ncbi:OX-2 membrane glycoprotein-like [Orycteropus afer afer]|uniref:OX-2 membrane glycoprotein-like n=1 Tax=Orycteropus afer afer TaxID=1230840 RepID=A0A8B7ACD4_ORYAF|nr:OX-2 membrane glycoprotein-like [Orycteropus afer afer]